MDAATEPKREIRVAGSRTKCSGTGIRFARVAARTWWRATLLRWMAAAAVGKQFIVSLPNASYRAWGERCASECRCGRKRPTLGQLTLAWQMLAADDWSGQGHLVWRDPLHCRSPTAKVAGRFVAIKVEDSLPLVERSSEVPRQLLGSG